jgi:hypothetical protein
MKLESLIQQELISGCNHLYTGFMIGDLPNVDCLDMIYSIPNEGDRSGYMHGQMKRMGLKKGIPDLCLPVRSHDGKYGSLYLEMKRSNGIVRPEQKAVHSRLRDLGNKVVVCRSAESGLHSILEYLNRWDLIDFGVSKIIHPLI